VALESALNLDGALRKSSLSAKDIEVIKLAVSQQAGCDYCLAAHTLMSSKAGLSADSIMAARKGGSTGDARLDALATFTRTLVQTSGTVPAADVAAVKAAGVTDAQLADVTLAIASITLTNLFNRINDTVVEFPAVPA
jgi:AhpD family alkylhydroperoxidase